MKSLTEQPAVLSVHEGTNGQYILRVADVRHRPLVIGVTKLLTDATSFVLITPSDIKVFNVVGGNGTGPTEIADAIPETTDVVDAETQAAIDAIDAGADPGAPPASEIVGETPQQTKVVRRKRPAPVAGHDEQCQRCSGAGKIEVLMDGGKPAETTCPICRGEGIMRRYGARR